MRIAGKVIDHHTVINKGDHFFHSSYLAVEALIGHGPLAWLATGALLFVVADLVVHWMEH